MNPLNHNLAILKRLDSGTLYRLKNSSAKAQKLENIWVARVKDHFKDKSEYIIKALEEGRGIERELQKEIQDLFVKHYFETAIEGMRSAANEEPELKQPQRRLAKFPVIKIPNSLKDLMKLYDQWKKGRYTPKRPKALAEKITKQYLKRVHSVWEKHSEDFRKGDAFTQAEVKKKIQSLAETTSNRASTIVRTETTNYYNEARKELYDQSKDVTHYLFLAVRDAATTRWCTPGTIEGKRGRHGLVYAKTDPLCDQERPGCHWNCRSEYVPLTPLNPSHKKLIEDKSLQRRSHQCYPLPKGWKS